MTLNIITISYRIDEELIKTISSVDKFIQLNQNNSTINHVVVYKEGLPNEHLQSNYRIVKKQSLEGRYNAMNLGLAEVKPYSSVIFINAGDLMEPIRLNNFSLIKMINLESTALIRFQSLYECSGQIVPKHNDVIQKRIFSHQAVIVKMGKEIIKFDESYKISGDKEWYFNLLFTQKFELIPISQILCKMNCDGISRNGKNELLKFKEDTKIDLKYNQLTLKLLILRTTKTICKIILNKTIPTYWYNNFLKYIAG